MLSGSLTSILISRFLLNLQATDRKSTGMVSSTGSQLDSAILQGIIGSLGNDIVFGKDVNVDAVEEDGVREKEAGIGAVQHSFSEVDHTEGVR